VKTLKKLQQPLNKKILYELKVDRSFEGNENVMFGIKQLRLNLWLAIWK